MITKVIKIGNSMCIRIPVHMLEQSCLKDQVEIEVKGNKLIVKPTSHVREGWGLAFQRMSENKDDILLDKKSLGNSFPRYNEEWEW